MRRATNPLLDEEFVVRDVINKTVDSARLDVLRTLNDRSIPVAQTEIIRHCPVSRQTTVSHLETLRNHGFVKNHNTGIEPTSGGEILLEIFEECLETLSEEELARLTRSQHPINILHSLAQASCRTSDLPAAVSSKPSRSAVNRFLDFSDKRDWTRDESGTQQITAAGKEALIAYDTLSASVEQIIKKAAWLQRLPLKDATFPVCELPDAKVIASDTDHPAAVLWNALKLIDLRISRFRALCSIYNPILYHAYKMMLDHGVEAEAILDWSSYVEASRNEHTHYAVHSSEYSNYQPMYLKESDTLGIGLYDSRKVAIGAYNEKGRGKHIAMLVSSNDRLVEWGEQLFESYREKAHHSHENPSTDAIDSPSESSSDGES
jgi:predicted transcriptional regulator